MDCRRFRVDNSPWCSSCALRKFHKDISPPCRHWFAENGIKINLNEIPAIYIRNIRNNEIYEKQIQKIIKETDPRQLNYTDYIAQITPYVSAANNNEKIANILSETIIKLKNECSTVPNVSMPPTLTLKGKISNHPSKNVVLSGCPKTKREYKCLKCHCTGHNCKSCPKI